MINYTKYIYNNFKRHIISNIIFLKNKKKHRYLFIIIIFTLLLLSLYPLSIRGQNDFIFKLVFFVLSYNIICLSFLIYFLNFGKNFFNNMLLNRTTFYGITELLSFAISLCLLVDVFFIPFIFFIGIDKIMFLFFYTFFSISSSILFYSLIEMYKIFKNKVLEDKFEYKTIYYRIRKLCYIRLFIIKHILIPVIPIGCSLIFILNNHYYLSFISLFCFSIIFIYFGIICILSNIEYIKHYYK